MKKVIKVSINKMPFTLAEDAYSVLKVYLDHLRRYYSGREGGSEIVDGIEERIAELLAERTGMDGRVVSKADIDNILEIMGPVEVIEEEGEEPAPGTGTFRGEPRPPKKLYRDVDHKILCGVCSGLAAYFNIEVVLVRLIYAVLFFLPSIIHWSVNFRNWGGFIFNFPWIFVVAYVVMWIIIPAAHTVEEKYAMRGEPLSAKGVQRSRPRPSGARRYSYEPKPASAERNRILGTLGRVIAVLVGLFFLVTSSAVLIGLVVAFSATGFAFNFFPTALLDLFAFPENMLWFKIFLMGALVIPVLGFIHLGSVLVFNIRGHKWIGSTLFFLWLASVVGLLITGAHGAGNFRHNAHFEETVPLELTSDTLYIDLVSEEDFMFDRYWLKADNSYYRLGWFEGERDDLDLVAFPPITIVRQSESEMSGVLVGSHSFGRSQYMAQQDAEALKPAINLEGNVMSVPAFQANREKPWEGNTGSLKIYVPSKQVIIVRKPIYHEFGVSRSKKVNLIRSE
ncbi:MAG: PspC domain-containing protein [Bacteroidales bacterium]|jgi:phage shock protein PspC (stress-responsive transcriptional regulator)|nr:PspC domain-containing protein [Bacteroidales bacterium]